MHNLEQAPRPREEAFCAQDEQHVAVGHTVGHQVAEVSQPATEQRQGLEQTGGEHARARNGRGGRARLQSSARSAHLAESRKTG